MIRVRGRHKNNKLELETPLDLAEGTEVDIVVQPAGESTDPEKADWSQLGMSRLEEEWDNSQDAIYDDWKKLYGIQAG